MQFLMISHERAWKTTSSCSLIFVVSGQFFKKKRGETSLSVELLSDKHRQSNKSASIATLLMGILPSRCVLWKNTWCAKQAYVHTHTHTNTHRLTTTCRKSSGVCVCVKDRLDQCVSAQRHPSEFMT